MQGLKEKKWWIPRCAAVLTAAAVAVTLISVYAPREEKPPEETETVPTAAVVTAPLPTLTPAPEPTPTPVITPPAQSAASGSDVILTHVPLSTDSDLDASPETDM